MINIHCVCFVSRLTSFHIYIYLVCSGTPRLVVVTPVNSTTVTVSWSEVQCFNGGGVVIHYLVQYQSMFGGTVQNVTMDGIVQTVSGLTPNATVYTFQVAAVGLDQMIGPFSDTANVSALGKHGTCVQWTE